MNQKNVWAIERRTKEELSGPSSTGRHPAPAGHPSPLEQSWEGAVPTFASQSIHHPVPPSHPKLMSLASQRGGHFEMILKIVYEGKIHIT